MRQEQKGDKMRFHHLSYIDDCLKSRIPARRISSWNVDKNTERSRTDQLVRHKIGPASQSGFAARRLIIDTAMAAGSNSESQSVPTGLKCDFLRIFSGGVDERRRADNRQGKKGGKNAISAFFL